MPARAVLFALSVMAASSCGAPGTGGSQRLSGVWDVDFGFSGRQPVTVTVDQNRVLVAIAPCVLALPTISGSKASYELEHSRDPAQRCYVEYPSILFGPKGDGSKVIILNSASFESFDGRNGRLTVDGAAWPADSIAFSAPGLKR